MMPYRGPSGKKMFPCCHGCNLKKLGWTFRKFCITTKRIDRASLYVRNEIEVLGEIAFSRWCASIIPIRTTRQASSLQ